jgi:hypothetical protein
MEAAGSSRKFPPVYQIALRRVPEDHHLNVHHCENWKSANGVIYFLQLIATPFAYGSVYFDPLWALITLAISYFFGK